MHKFAIALVTAAVTLPMFGCSVGRDSVLFVTRTEVAVDFDSAPPTADIGYKRDELVLAPIDKNGHVLPVMTTVGTGAAPLDVGSNHSFATGLAALVMCKYLLSQFDLDLSAESDKLTLTNLAALDAEGNAIEGDRKRYYFGTNTVIGLGVQWNAADIPQAVSIGMKRKELAFIPLGNQGDKKALASLIATASGEGKVGSQQSTGVTIGQTFATGAAATLLASHPAVRRALGPSLVPNFNDIVAEVKESDAKAVALAARRKQQQTILDQIVVRYDSGDDATKKKILGAAQQQGFALLPTANPLTATNDVKKELSKATNSGSDEDTARLTAVRDA